MSEFVSVVHLPTWEVRPDIPQEVFDQERAALGEQFDAEYGARFLGSGSALLAEGDIRGCVRPGGDIDPREGSGWVVGADLAWRRDRSAAVVAGHVGDGDDRLTVAAVRMWDPPKDLSGGHERHQETVIREIAELAAEYGNAVIFADTMESATVRARFAAHGAFCNMVAMGGGGKSDIYRELARRVRGGLIRFPDDPVLIAELRRLRIRYGGQRPTIENPRSGGGHGDVAQALAQAVGAMASEADEPPAAVRTIQLAMPYSSGGEFG
jgi:phage terminase large subunit-like protein